MDFLTQLFFDCGWLYSAALVGSFAVAIIFLVRSLIRRSTHSAWTTLLLALLPLAIGLYGTFEANRAIKSVLDSSEVQAKPEELDDAYRAARTTSYLGGVLTVLLLPLAVAVISQCCGSQARKQDDEPRP